MMYSKAFIFPSLYEGFGIPPLEALSVGTKIIISNTSCLPEIYEDSAYYIDPCDYNNVNIDKLLLARVSNPKVILDKYSWSNSAKLFLKMIKEIVDEKN